MPAAVMKEIRVYTGTSSHNSDELDTDLVLMVNERKKSSMRRTRWRKSDSRMGLEVGNIQSLQGAAWAVAVPHTLFLLRR